MKDYVRESTLRLAEADAVQEFACGSMVIQRKNVKTRRTIGKKLTTKNTTNVIPKAELDGVMGESKMGLHARLMSQACRKLVGSVAKHNVLMIFINQVRNKIGVTYGSPEVTTGGMALQFYASVRLDVKRSTSEGNSIMNGDVKEGNKTTVKVVKNKCSAPFKQAQFYIMYGTGIDNISELVDLAVEKGVIKKMGSWYSYEENKLGQGTAAVKQLFLDNDELYNEILEKTINPVVVE